MCTLTYLPKKTGFILTSSRDEKRARAKALAPAVFEKEGVEIMAPVDGAAKGTWIGINQLGRTACLLNGAFEAHISTGNYARSRGLITLEALTAPDLEFFLENTSLEGVEPFTLVIIDENDGLSELRWDGSLQFYRKLPSDTPHIWSSATLYNPDARAIRESWFQHWLQQRPLTDTKTVTEFQLNTGKEFPEIAFCMKRGEEYATVSLTSVEKYTDTVDMTYLDLLADSRHTAQLQLFATNSIAR